jgi:hypothetical protein
MSVDRSRRSMDIEHTDEISALNWAALGNRTPDLRITRSPGPLSGRATCTDRLTRAPDCSQRTARTIFRATTRATTRPALSNRALLARVALAPRSAGEALVSFS